LVQTVRKRHAGNLHFQFISHGEVRDALASWWVFLGKVDLSLGSKLGTPQAHASLQGPQHACVPLAGIAALKFFEQGDGVEPGIEMAWRPSLLSELVEHINDLEDSAPSSRAIRRLLDDGMTSAGGERPKVTLQHEGRLWLAKLQDRGDVPHLPAREFVVMQMAEELDIQVPRILLEQHEGREVFLVERFDRCGDPVQPQRHLFASAHTVLGLEANITPGDARRSYLVFAEQMRRWIADKAALQIDLQELWRRMAYNALVGNGDDHPRNHGLIHDGTGWRLSKAFDITPLLTFVRVLAMGVAADGSQDCSAPSLLRSCSHFGVDLPEAAAWLIGAARHIANEWQQRLRANGVPAGHLAQFTPAFALACELAENPDLLDEAIAQIELQGRKGRRGQRPR
jgi:serine/threonine-protein kinase HipA